MASVLLALEAERLEKAGKIHEQHEQDHHPLHHHHHHHHYLEWHDVGSSKPETGVEIHNEALRDALIEVVQSGRHMIWFPEGVMHDMQVPACTLHSYIEVGVGETIAYFMPTGQGQVRRDEGGRIVHFRNHADRKTREAQARDKEERKNAGAADDGDGGDD